MAAGIQVYNQSGFVQIDEQFKNYHLIRSGQFTASAAATNADLWWSTFYQDTWRYCTPFAMIALVAPAPGLVASVGSMRSGVKMPNFLFYGGGPITFQFYIFDLIPPAPSGAGLQVYAPDASLVYDAASLQMRVLAQLRGIAQWPYGQQYAKAFYTQPEGKPIAWVCTSGGYQYDDDGDDVEVYATYTYISGTSLIGWTNYSLGGGAGIPGLYGNAEQQGLIIDTTYLPANYARYS